MTVLQDEITQDHGAGAEPMRDLLEELVLPRFAGDGRDDVGLAALDDGAVFPVGDHAVVVTTDNHVVDPLRFPGGDIGRLAVSGTVNDLAMMGATESVALTNSLIVEDGLDLDVLDDVFASMEATCEEADCRIVAGDTKVLAGDDVDRLVMNTAGVGLIPRGEHVSDAGLRPGDRVVVSGTVGDHGIALLAAREDIGFGAELESDVAPIDDLVDLAREAGEVTAMKDPTRGGLSTALNEMAGKAEVGIEIEESAVPVRDDVEGAGELLGIDPLDVANEGKFVFTVPESDAEAVVSALRDHSKGTDAAVIGEVVDDHAGDVVLDTGVGRRFLTEPVSEPLPRIC
ncbi:MAG: hydrogenase expression/formation protein HypE [Halobacteriales archaeon]